MAGPNDSVFKDDKPRVSDYDPVKDEKKPMTLKDFEKTLKECVTDFSNDFEDANDFMRGKHTFNEWMASFGRWMSW